MSDTYAILAYAENLDGPEVLYESEWASDCERFVKRYTQFGDWGGYDCLALYEVAPYETAFCIHMTDPPIVTWEKESL